MKKENLKKVIDVASGREPADLVIKNIKMVNVYTGNIEETSIGIVNGIIAGTGTYEGKRQIDGNGMFAVPGFIDSHIHIESSYLRPEEFGKLLVPYGCTSVIADPHEIVNVAGIKALEYMIDASKGTKMDIKFMLPSCVPATPMENSGASLDASDMKEPISKNEVLGLGEYMNFPGVIKGSDSDLNKIKVAMDNGKIIDGHCPGIKGKDLNAYVAAGIHTDHECSTIEEMNDRISRGMYVLLREGSACKNLSNLMNGITEKNSRRCLLCSDDRQPKTVFNEGHIDGLLRKLVKGGIDPITAIRMATLNAAECYRLFDRGAIAPGLRADICLINNLEEFHVEKVFIKGELVAENGEYIPKIDYEDPKKMEKTFHIKGFSVEKLKLNLKSHHVNVIEIKEGGVLTNKSDAYISLDKNGDYLKEQDKDILKIAVVERHKKTGNVAVGFIKGYGLKEGAVALSVAHDSHNIIATGISNEEIAFAVEKLINQNGGIVLSKEGKVIESLPLPIGGLMTDKDGKYVAEKLDKLHKAAYENLGISKM